MPPAERQTPGLPFRGNNHEDNGLGSDGDSSAGPSDQEDEGGSENSSGSESDSSSGDSGPEAEAARGVPGTQRAREHQAHRLRMRILRLENERLQAIVAEQDFVLEEMALRTSEIRQATAERQAELDSIRAARALREAAEAVEANHDAGGAPVAGGGNGVDGEGAVELEAQAAVDRVVDADAGAREALREALQAEDVE